MLCDAADDEAFEGASSAAHVYHYPSVLVVQRLGSTSAIPKLLEMLEISGSLVTIDAMGCQTEIAAQIVEQGGDYCLAVKGNQPTLHHGIVEFFEDATVRRLRPDEGAAADTTEHGHGRDEERTYFVCPGAGRPAGPRPLEPV